MSAQLEMYNGKVWGKKVSEEGLRMGYLDFQTMAEIMGSIIINNDIFDYLDEWDLVSGEHNRELASQDYIITKYGYEFLKEYTDETVYHHYDTNIFLWSVAEYGTRWDYVLTNIKLVDGDK